MATWPTGTKASTANLDAGTDSPRLARADIKQNVDNVNSIIDMFNIDSPTANQVLKYNTSNARFELGTDDAGSSGDITFVGDDSTGTAVSLNETFKIAGATGITTAVSGDTLTITGTAQDFAYSSLTGAPTNVSSFTNDAGYITDDGNGDLTITNSTIQSSGDTIDLDDIVRFNVGYKEDINALTSSASISVDATTAPVHTVTLAHAATFTISNMVSGQSILIIITQDGTGARTGTFTSVKFPGGAPTLSTGAGDIDVISVFYDGTNYLGNIAQDFTT
jgi:hypothetical protein